MAALLLVRQRLGVRAAAHLEALAPQARTLPHLPEEIWLAVCAFLRGADFMP